MSNLVNDNSNALKKLSIMPKTRSAKLNFATAIFGVVLTVILGFTIPNFMELGNIFNIIEQLSILGFMSLGMTYVMISGGVDLSMHTVVSAASVVGATMMVNGFSPFLGCLVMILIGITFGLINGFAIAVLRMIPFIVTLSTMVLAQGFAIWFTKTVSVSGLPSSYIYSVSGKLFGIIPVPGIIILVVTIIAGVVLSRTKYGRWIYLTGSNEQAARISGLPTLFTKFSTYIFSGMMAGITAVVLTAMVSAATTAMVRDERLMDIIAATVIGGASLTGGTGNVFGTILGLLFITVLGNCFNLLGLSPFIAMLIKGLVLVIIIGLDRLRSRS